MTFDYFLEASKIVAKYVAEFLEPKRELHNLKRRELTKQELAKEGYLCGRIEEIHGFNCLE